MITSNVIFKIASNLFDWLIYFQILYQLFNEAYIFLVFFSSTDNPRPLFLCERFQINFPWELHFLYFLAHVLSNPIPCRFELLYYSHTSKRFSLRYDWILPLTPFSRSYLDIDSSYVSSFYLADIFKFPQFYVVCYPYRHKCCFIVNAFILIKIVQGIWEISFLECDVTNAFTFSFSQYVFMIIFIDGCIWFILYPQVEGVIIIICLIDFFFKLVNSPEFPLRSEGERY